MAARLVETRLSDDERFDWLRLIRSENVGPRTFRALLDRCGGAAAALAALPELARRGGAGRPIRVAGVDEIERELEDGAASSASASSPIASRTIRRRCGISTPRRRCSRCAAARKRLQQPAVAIVGSRNASAAGLAFADRLARGLGAGRLRRRFRPGARHRPARPRRFARDRHDRRARRRPRQALSARGRAAAAAHRRERRDRLGNADRMGAARARLPAPQPHRLRPGAGRRSSSRRRAAPAR